MYFLDDVPSRLAQFLSDYSGICSTYRNLILLIDARTFIPGETQDDPRRLRIAIDLPEFRRIPKAGHITDYSKAESTGVRYEVQRCVTPQLNLLLFRFVAFHRDMKFIYCGVLFLRRF